MDHRKKQYRRLFFIVSETTDHPVVTINFVGNNQFQEYPDNGQEIIAAPKNIHKRTSQLWDWWQEDNENKIASAKGTDDKVWAMVISMRDSCYSSNEEELIMAENNYFKNTIPENEQRQHFRLVEAQFQSG